MYNIRQDEHIYYRMRWAQLILKKKYKNGTMSQCIHGVSYLVIPLFEAHDESNLNVN